uniref:Uncharacterized protein n=1 Tax=Amphimedon queenslandica TaxID=400682 RepID=A0A1X7US78_AMPQE
MGHKPHWWVVFHPETLKRREINQAGISCDDANMSNASVCDEGKYVNNDLLKKSHRSGIQAIEHSPRIPI